MGCFSEDGDRCGPNRCRLGLVYESPIIWMDDLRLQVTLSQAAPDIEKGYSCGTPLLKRH